MCASSFIPRMDNLRTSLIWRESCSKSSALWCFFPLIKNYKTETLRNRSFFYWKSYFSHNFSLVLREYFHVLAISVRNNIWVSDPNFPPLSRKILPILPNFFMIFNDFFLQKFGQFTPNFPTFCQDFWSIFFTFYSFSSHFYKSFHRFQHNFSNFR